MKFVEGLIAGILSVFAPIKPIIITMIVLVFVDLITGVLAARKRGEKINSAGIRRTVVKLTLYLTAICIGYLVEKYMLSDYLAVSKIAAGLIGLVETKSLFENIDILNGEPIFKSLIKKLGSVNDDIKEDVTNKVIGKDE